MPCSGFPFLFLWLALSYLALLFPCLPSFEYPPRPQGERRTRYRWPALARESCERRDENHTVSASTSTAFQPAGDAAPRTVYAEVGWDGAPSVWMDGVGRMGTGWGCGYLCFGGEEWEADNTPYPRRPLLPPSHHDTGTAKSLHPPRHLPPRPRRRPTLTPNPYTPASSSLSALPPSSPSAPTSHSDGWAIWSRRPRDPAHAPGVSSPRARPPPDVVASARAGEMAPPVPVERDRREGGEVVEGAMDGRVEEGAEEVEAPAAADADADADADTPSSSTDYTDTRTTATTVPGSPLSSATSVSASVSKAAEPAPAPAASTSASSPSLDAAPATPPPKNCGPLSFDSPLPLPPAPPQQQGPKTETKIGRPPDLFCGAGSGAAQSVGKNHAALRALLSAPAADATAAAPKSFADASASAAPTASEKTREERLTPRGLVNTGNMCFANAVLQVLDDGGGGGGVLGPAPLVRATGAFLREFIGSASAKKPVNGGAGGKGKGKVSPAEEQEEEPEAFIPTHIYDALKGKKRFDGMRVRRLPGRRGRVPWVLPRYARGGVVGGRCRPLACFGPSIAEGNRHPQRRRTGRAVVGEREEEAPPETEDGWLEVGRKNRPVVTKTVKSAESPITRIFGGRFRSTLRAPGQKDSSLRPAIQRFCYDMAVGGIVKVGKRVAFGPEFESGMMCWCQRRASNHYVVYYHGVSTSGGHYTLDMLHPMRFPSSAMGSGSEHDGWVHIDNELLSDVWSVDVFGVLEGDSQYATAEARKFSSTQGSIIPM
ncbi:hypothetical protein B0H14DRAFT_3169205 [Mycena olivaceomarginata]|nr:hypothetical protein B0H14DRAFT_3169205 [Mycena olivaceomarginata]